MPTPRPGRRRCHRNFPTSASGRTAVSAAISCPIKPCPWSLAVGIGEESLCRQFRSVQVSPRQPLSADVKLSYHAYWRWLPLLSQNVGASIRNRPSNRYASRLFCHSINFVSYRKGGRFSGAISVEQVLWAIAIYHPSDYSRIKRVAPDN